MNTQLSQASHQEPELIADAPDDNHRLLDDLQALKRVLDEPTSGRRPAREATARLIEDLDLAILDDVVTLSAADRVNHANLLDLGSIFEEQVEELSHTEAEAGAATRHSDPDKRAPAPGNETATARSTNPEQLRLLVQEVVDELVPLVENQLRQRLMQLSEDQILDLADAVLDS